MDTTVDRTVMTMWQLSQLRIYRRELCKMTPAERESAFVGFFAAEWENLPDRTSPACGWLLGLKGWLPA